MFNNNIYNSIIYLKGILFKLIYNSEIVKDNGINRIICKLSSNHKPTKLIIK